MNQPECDIWFGPGGLKGVFGAGVAVQLQIAIQRGEIDPSKLRLFGSSVGCLTATYLATGNARNGISLFQDDVRGLITRSNLLPSLGARFCNRIARTVSGPKQVFRVPSVLNIDLALDVMMRRTPHVVSQLRHAEMPTFAEDVHVRTGEIRHIELRSTQDPLQVIRNSLTCFPFAWSQATEVLDSSIAGYGFVNLIPAGFRKLVVVLNGDLSPRLRDPLGGIASAMLAGSTPISRLYLLRQRNRNFAVQSAMRCIHRVLLIAPERSVRVKKASEVQRAYDEGRHAARRIIDFVQVPCARNGAAERSARSA